MTAPGGKDKMDFGEIIWRSFAVVGLTFLTVLCAICIFALWRLVSL